VVCDTVVILMRIRFPQELFSMCTVTCDIRKTATFSGGKQHPLMLCYSFIYYFTFVGLALQLYNFTSFPAIRAKVFFATFFSHF